MHRTSTGIQSACKPQLVDRGVSRLCLHEIITAGPQAYRHCYGYHEFPPPSMHPPASRSVCPNLPPDQGALRSGGQQLSFYGKITETVCCGEARSMEMSDADTRE